MLHAMLLGSKNVDNQRMLHQSHWYSFPSSIVKFSPILFIPDLGIRKKYQSIAHEPSQSVDIPLETIIQAYTEKH